MPRSGTTLVEQILASHPKVFGADEVEFIPNSVLIFPRTNYSYHGVSSINIGSKERNLLLLNFYFKTIK